ncbi:MAG: hypothetical protein NT023_04645, partial [Armatimonadetes bacterium]|nr:hypothetical protein [Armatimonadota bacterium]
PFANSVKGVEYRAWAEEFLRCSFVTLTVLHKPYFLLRNPDFLAKVLVKDRVGEGVDKKEAHKVA